MKELSIKEKAKRYDEALERAKNFIENGDRGERTIAESIFAGFMEESEDERIRKRLMEWVEEFRKLNPTNADHNAECSEALAWLEKQGEQKPWSEEDEKMYTATIFALAGFMGNEDKIDWFKSLKDRVQPQQEWSEEDEKMVEDIIEAIDTKYAVSDYQKMVTWLKSLRPQNTWKPSYEQIKAVEESIEFLGCSKKVIEDLKSLYEQLKKLQL